jgi:hypothetical protein
MSETRISKRPRVSTDGPMTSPSADAPPAPPPPTAATPPDGPAPPAGAGEPFPPAPAAGTPDAYLSAARAITTLLELTALPLPGAAAAALGDAGALAHSPALRAASERLRAALFSFQASVLDAAPPIPRAFWDGKQMARLGWRERLAAYHKGVPLDAAGTLSVPLASWVTPRAAGGAAAMRWRPPPQDRAYLVQMQMCVKALEEQAAEFFAAEPSLGGDGAMEKAIKEFDGAYASLEAACKVIKAKRALAFSAAGPSLLGGGGGGSGGGGAAAAAAAAAGGEPAAAADA